MSDTVYGWRLSDGARMLTVLVCGHAVTTIVSDLGNPLTVPQLHRAPFDCSDTALEHASYLTDFNHENGFTVMFSAYALTDLDAEVAAQVRGEASLAQTSAEIRSFDNRVGYALAQAARR